MRFIFNLHSTFNVLFNIQLSIQHSTIHFEFNSLFPLSIIYSIISTSYSTFNYSLNIQLFIQYSTFHSTFNYSFQFSFTGETKKNIISEASALFKWEDQILVFQDGREVPDNFNIPSYTLTKKIRFPSRARASERLYLLHASEKKGICSNIYNIVNFFTNLL